MRFSRDLPSAMPMRSAQHSSVSRRWIGVIGMVAIMMLLVLFSRSADTTPIINSANVDTLSRPSETNDDGHQIPTVDMELFTNDDSVQQTDRQVQSAEKYIVLIDAGSSGSRCHVHAYSWDDPKGLPDIKPSEQKKIKPGLSYHATFKSEGAKQGISDLLEFAKSNVPLAARSQTRVYLQATAGLRSVTPVQAEEVLEHVRDSIAASGFKFKRHWARIIDGQEEGVFGWLAANYLLQSLDPREQIPTRGIAEMGGASMQLTYVPASIPVFGVDQDKLVTVAVLGKHYKLYTHSYLGYGLEAVQERHQHSPAIVDAVDMMGNPCYPVGYHHSSIGNWTLCYEWLKSVVPSHGDIQCPFGSCGIEVTYQPVITVEPFYAIENFYYTSQYFNVHQDDTFLAGLKQAGQSFCGRSWHHIIAENNELEADKRADVADLVKYCFATAYSTRVLEVGFGMQVGKTPVQVMRLINERQIDWALGSVLNSLVGAMKARTAQSLDSPMENARATTPLPSISTQGGSYVTVWLSIAMVPMVACYVIVKRVLPKWRR